jgi:hypothetical protein
VARDPIEDAARRWAAEDKLLAGLERTATAPTEAATGPDLHDYYRVKAALLARPFDLDKFAVELARFLALAEVTPDEFEEAASRTAA